MEELKIHYFKILNKKWTIRVLANDQYELTNGEGSVGTTDPNHALIDLSESGVTEETITHELVHAYMHELCLGSINDISKEDFEEIFAEFMSKRGKELLLLSKRIYNKLK